MAKKQSNRPRQKNRGIDARKPAAGDYSDERYRGQALRILASFKKVRPDKGKKWIGQEEHDQVLYGESED